MNELSSIYSQLVALRTNLPVERHVGKKYVDEYNSLLTKLEKAINFSLADFKVSESILEYTSGISRPGIGFEGFGEKQCERGFLLAKLDAVLLQFKPGEEQSPMGFQVQS